jgi:hypothetical protein
MVNLDQDPHSSEGWIRIHVKKKNAQIPVQLFVANFLCAPTAALGISAMPGSLRKFPKNALFY